VTTLDVSDHEILVSSVDGCIRIYDIRAGKLITDVMGDPVGCAKFSGDGQSMLVQTLNSKIRLLDKESGTLLNTYTGHTNTEYRLRCTFTRMDTHIVSGSEDGAVVCWDILEVSIIFIYINVTHL
jgi:mitogen-activated protein kinase organizer 1